MDFDVLFSENYFLAYICRMDHGDLYDSLVRLREQAKWENLLGTSDFGQPDIGQDIEAEF